MFVVFPPHTRNNCIVFGKNADRPNTEVQELVHRPAKDYESGAKLQCTYIEIEECAHTHSVVLSKPAWTWGAEMGANEHGVCIGKAAVWTKLNGPDDLEERLLGADLVRLGLERSTSAREAIVVITTLIHKYGQGGPCSEEHGLTTWAHHNSFIAVDRTEAWLLETAGSLWAAKRLKEGHVHISNKLTIHSDADMTSTDLISKIIEAGSYKDSDGDFDFAKCLSVEPPSDTSATQQVKSGGSEDGCCALKEMCMSSSDSIGVLQMCALLRKEECSSFISGPFMAASSQVSILTPPADETPCSHWFTATPNPCLGLFKPFIFGPGTDIGGHTISPDYGDEDPAKIKPRFQKKVSREHPLYTSQQKLRELVDQDDPKAKMILEHLKELEENCFGDVDEILNNYTEKTCMQVAQLFDHLCSIEINFYK